MIGDAGSPLGTLVLVFPFQNLFNDEFFGLSGIVIMNNPKTAAAYVAQKISFFKNFFPADSGKYAVKMYGFSGPLVREGGRDVKNGFTAKGTFGRGKRFRRNLGRSPFGSVRNPEFFSLLRMERPLRMDRAIRMDRTILPLAAFASRG